MSPARLRLDAATCVGHAICVLCCPDRLALDEWGYPLLDPTPLVAAGELARARRAVAACPEGALHLEPLAGHRPGAPDEKAPPRPVRTRR